MSTNEPDYLEFRGRDLKECEEFISAVNKQARAQGKFRDDQWIADLVGASMAGDALLWWSALDQETQRSWRSLQQAMILRYRLHFSGKNGAEAEHFVHWVRQRALDVGKLDDPHWAAALASGCFVGSALRWYTSLDPGIRGDWDSLQQAIFVEYGQNFQGVSWSLTVPTPAAAATAPILPRRRARGRIQVKRQDDSRVYYLSKVLNTEPDYLGRVMVTQHVVEALEVEYESIPPFDDPRTLFIPDNQIPGCDALGMKWKMTDTTAAAETNVLALCGIDLSSGAGSLGPLFFGAILTKPWKISRSAHRTGTMSLWGFSESGDYLLPLSSQRLPEYIWFKYMTLARAGQIAMELFFEPV